MISAGGFYHLVLVFFLTPLVILYSIWALFRDRGITSYQEKLPYVVGIIGSLPIFYIVPILLIFLLMGIHLPEVQGVLLAGFVVTLAIAAPVIYYRNKKVELAFLMTPGISFLWMRLQVEMSKREMEERRKRLEEKEEEENKEAVGDGPITPKVFFRKLESL